MLSRRSRLGCWGLAREVLDPTLRISRNTSRAKVFDFFSSRREADVAMIYDAFSPKVFVQLENHRICGRGEAKDFIWEGNTRPGGKLPLNTNGGGLSYTHTGMYGMFALQESIRQMRGTAPAQVQGAKISVCHGVGGMFAASGTIVFTNEG